ncbi:MAG: hypothetical protein GXP25_15125 [Planctomycetes bacterium]|nr:hypothetical protein [Planctomycetota bacterium]
MKRLLLILPLLCLVAHADEIPGWQVPPQGWTCKKGIISATPAPDKASRIVTADQHEAPNLSFQLRVPKWTEGGAIGVYWGMRGITGEDSYHRFAINIRPSQVQIGKMEGAGNSTSLDRFSASVPAGKWVPVLLKYKKGKLMIMVGKGRKTIALNPAKATGYLAINSHKVNIEIRKLKTK